MRKATLALGLLLALIVAGCDRSGPPPRSLSGPIQVVAAENFWGSLAAQLGGARVRVNSIIVNPNTDPHSYEPNARDGRTIALSQMAIVNGIGYDEWASRLLRADSGTGRMVLSVGSLLGKQPGANPHQWYSPTSVRRVIERITADYQRLDPDATAYFAERQRVLLTSSFALYNALLAKIRANYAGVPVGYSESIFQPLGEALGLRLLTPYSFAKAIAEGTDVTAQDKQTVDRQVTERRIAVWVFNSQNVTPDVQRVNALARSHHVPIATVTETLSPASATFEQWQSAELTGLLRALRLATGH